MIISNSTPLINFSAIRRPDILHRLFGKIHIPPAVENELFVKGKHYPAMNCRASRHILLCQLQPKNEAEEILRELNEISAEDGKNRASPATTQT